MKKARKTVFVAFRVEENIAKRFDDKAAEVGLKRPDLLRNFMRVFGHSTRQDLAETVDIMGQLREIDALRADAERLAVRMARIMTKGKRRGRGDSLGAPDGLE